MNLEIIAACFSYWQVFLSKNLPFLFSLTLITRDKRITPMSCVILQIHKNITSHSFAVCHFCSKISLGSADLEVSSPMATRPMTQDRTAASLLSFPAASRSFVFSKCRYSELIRYTISTRSVFFKLWTFCKNSGSNSLGSRLSFFEPCSSLPSVSQFYHSYSLSSIILWK